MEEISPVTEATLEVLPHEKSGISRPISSEVSESRSIELVEIGELEVAEVSPAEFDLLAKVGEGSLEKSDSLDQQRSEPKSAQEIAAAESQDGNSPKIPKASVASVAFSSAKSTGVESDTLPNASSQAIPEYPPELLSKGVEGVVVLKIEVSSSGDVLNCSLYTTSGYPEMDQSALKAVKTWKFVPAKLLGQSVACTVLKKVRFKIVPQEPVPSNSSVVPAQ
ncbi:MAG: TonB family protein [Planctomycetaceae bacterium]